jgi:protease PrsW
LAEREEAGPAGRPRWRWLTVLVSGFTLWVLSVAVTGITGNPNLIPTVVLLGSFLVPAAAVVYYLDHDPSTAISGQRVFLAFVYGGVVGILLAALLEAWLLQNSPLIYLGVGLIEEFAKLLALLLVARGVRTHMPRDGIVLGTAVGFGFAAFESSGYALNALFTPNGLSLANLVFTEVLRGILAPVGHGLWTGILGGVLFETAFQGRLTATWRLLRAYLGVSLLHALWDSMRGIALLLTVLVGAASVPAAGTPAAADVNPFVFVGFEMAGLAMVSVAGLWLLRRAWRRSPGALLWPGDQSVRGSRFAE